MIKIERAGLVGIAVVLSACGSSAQLDSKATAFGWTAEPAMIANAGVYRGHEFVYQDYVYDDKGANTDGRDRFDAPLGTPGPDPQDPVNPRLSPAPLTNWAGDFQYSSPDNSHMHTVADFIEFRTSLDAQRVYYRFRMGDMTAPDSAVIGVCVDEDHDPSNGLETWPLGANHTEQLGCDHFYTVWGTGGSASDAHGVAQDFKAIGAEVSADMGEALIEFSVPRAYADPGRKTWRFYVASGVWDGSAWVAPAPIPTQAGAPVATGGNLLAPNIYDMLSNNQEPNSTWNEEKQANDLTAHHLVDDYLDVDFARIADGANDPDPRRTGVVERIYRSGFPYESRGIVIEGGANKEYLGEYQPYVAVIPSNYYDDPDRLFAFDFCMHPLGANHNVEVFYAEAFAARDYNPVVTGVFPSTGYLGFTQVTSLIDRQQLVYACVLGRGEGVGYTGGDGLVDALEVQDDMLARYRIDDAHRTVHGVSLGAIGTWYMARTYPDRWSAAMPYIFTSGLGTGGIAADPTLANLYNLPVFYSIGTFDQFGQGTGGDPMADQLEGFGDEYLFLHYFGRQHEGRIEQDFLPFVAKLAYTRTRDHNPARVKFAFNPSMYDVRIPGKGGAYWVGGMVPRGAGAATIDVIALPLAAKLPKKQIVFDRLYENPNRLYSTRMRGLFRVSREEYDALWHPEQWEPGWVEASPVKITEKDLNPPKPGNAFVLVAANLASVTLDTSRMQLGGGATYVIVTDGALTVHLSDGRVLTFAAAGSYEGIM